MQAGILVLLTLVSAAANAAEPEPASASGIELHFIDDAQAVAGWADECIAGGEFAAIAAHSAPDPRMAGQDRKTLAAALGEAEFTRIATATWSKANTTLPQGPIRVCVDFAPASDTFTRDAMGGVAGVTAGHGRILLKVSPDADWKSVLPYALAHEMHHSYWAQHYFHAGQPFTLADYMVFEGRADYFAGTLFPYRAPWDHALDANAYAKAWHVLSKQLDATDPKTLMAGMFGSPQAGIPMWAGYSIGYRLVSERMAREPKLDLAAMTAAPAAEFMPRSGAVADAAPAPAAGFLFLGSYHMANHNRDVHNTRADDVLAAKRQQEIAEVARLIERYRPTKVMVEANPSSQAKLDAEFAASCKGDRPLGRDEIEQVGYRVACDLGLPGVIGVNWNELGPIPDEASVDYGASIERHGQQEQRARDMAIGNAQAARDQAVLDHGSIGDMLWHLNSPEWLAANARAYFRIGLYGTADDPTGANWVMLWHGRNLIIFNNIARNTAPGDRVLVVYGAGHGNLLRQFAADSGFYRLEDTERWLRPDQAP